MNPDTGRRKLVAFGVASAAAAGLGSFGNARAASVWHLATGYGGISFHALNIGTMLTEVDDATHGDLRVVLHADNSLVKLADIPAAVQAGRLEAGETIMSNLIAEVPVAGADTVPFITASYADARKLWRCQRPLIEKHFAERGMQALYAVAWPPQGLFSRRPITQLSDFKGCKLRSYGATTQRLAALLGATPIEVPYSQVGQALADGRIDCMITSAVTGVENQAWRQLAYYYEINAWYPKNIVFANAAAMKALPAADRDALIKASASAEQRGWAMSEAVATASVAQLRSNGMKTERISAEFALAFKRLGERQSLEWVKQVGLEANQIFVPYFTQQ